MARARPELATRRRVGAAVLVLLLLWPALHRVLVQRYRLSPWKYGAWAMYCIHTPRFQVTLEAEGQRLPLPPVPAARLKAYTTARGLWGRLAPPDMLAAEVAARSSFRSVEISIYEINVRAEDARVGAVDAWRYTYRLRPTPELVREEAIPLQ